MQTIQTIHVQSINDLCFVVNEWATAKGWNDTPDTLSHKCEQIALMHSELSECLEYLRVKVTCPHCGSKDTELFEQRTLESLWACQGKCLSSGKGNTFFAPTQPMDDHVPSITGEAAELADVLIRIFHYCGKRNIDLGHALQLKHAYNVKRPYRHGKNN